jgi:hypothetical protein
LLEEMAEDRTSTTWKTLVDKRLQALSTGVLYLVSDRAKALVQLAEQGLECFSMPDFFHLMHEIVKSYSLVLGRRVRQAHKELTEAQAGLARLSGRPQAAQAAPEATAVVATTQAEVTRWEEAHQTYRNYLETLSLTLHPFRIADAAPQTSAQVASRLQAAVEAIEVFAQRHQLPTRQATITKVRKQLPALAALVDFWWEGVRRDVAHAALSPLGGQWAEECSAIPALSQRSYTTYAGGLSRSLFRLPEAVCDTPFKARSEARRNPLQRWVSIWIKLRHE